MWEKNLKKSGYMYMSNWFTLLYSRNWQTVLNQLYSNEKFKNFFGKKNVKKERHLCSHACLCTQSLQSCPTLFDPMDYNPPCSSVHGILQARILEWVAMPSSRGSSPPGDWTHVCLCLLHCRWILYPLSYLESPFVCWRAHKHVNNFLA